MGRRQRSAVRLRLVVLEILVEIERIGAADGGLRRVGHDLPDPVSPVAENDIAVHVPAIHQRGPLEADQRGEDARVVELLRRVDHVAPDRRIATRAGRILLDQLRLHVALREGRDQVHRRGDGVLAAGAKSPRPAPALFELRHVRRRRQRVVDQPHPVGMIGDDEPVERARQADRLTGRGHDLLAARQSIGVARPDPVAEPARIHREGGVKMRLAPERAFRKGSTGVGRIGLPRINVDQTVFLNLPLLGGGRKRERRAQSRRSGDRCNAVLHDMNLPE